MLQDRRALESVRSVFFTMDGAGEMNKQRFLVTGGSQGIGAALVELARK